MEKVKIDLIIENTGSMLTGRVNYNLNLIIENGSTLTELESKIKKLLLDFENLNPDNILFNYISD